MTDQIIASISGGKDSTALCLHLKEKNIPYQAVHMDTGWEAPETDEYIRDILEKKIGPIVWIGNDKKMVELIQYKGTFPSRVMRYCTQFLKIFPIIDWMETNLNYKPVNAVGIRAAESKARAKLTEYEDVEWATTWRPLLSWSEQDVIEIHKRHNVLPNPLYLRGMSRVGCWPCIFARKSEIKFIADYDPQRIDLIRKLEQEVAEKARKRWIEKGKPIESFLRPTFFSRQLPGSNKTSCISIDKVVRWSRFEGQLELFHEPDRSGCMKWGLCD